MIAAMYVEIRERRADGGERTVATFRWDGQMVSCDNAVVWNHLIQATGGVVVGERGRKYTPRDGEGFLRNLRFQYRGPYLFAHELDDRTPAPEPAPPPESETPPPPVEVPDDPAERRRALDRAVFLVSSLWGAMEPTAALRAHATLRPLLEAIAGTTVAQVFADPEHRIKLQNARYGVTPPPVVPRLVARTDREWQRLQMALLGGDWSAAIMRAQLMGEILRLLAVHDHAWDGGFGLVRPAEGCCVGVRPGEPEAAWDELEWVTVDGEPTLGFLERASRRAGRAIERASELAPGGELHKAMIALRQAVTYDPWANEGRTLLGEVLLRMDHPLAEQELGRALLVERVRYGVGAPPATRLGSVLRRLRQQQALARCALVQGRTGGGREHLESALALVEDARELAGSGKGGVLDEEQMREITDRTLAVLANLAREAEPQPASLAVDDEPFDHGAGRPQAVGGGAEDSAGMASPLTGGEETPDTR
jgi:hypothetical protein